LDQGANACGCNINWFTFPSILMDVTNWTPSQVI
jgi:hypothetical protein